MKSKIIKIILVAFLVVFVVQFGFLFFISIYQTIKNDNKPAKDSVKLSEEQIWKDARSNDIYNLEILLNEIANPDFIEEIRKLENNNTFAKKFISLYAESNIEKIYKDGSVFDILLMYSYVSSKTNYRETNELGSPCELADKYPNINFDEYQLNDIFYSSNKFDNNGKPLYGNDLCVYGIDYYFEYINISTGKLTVIKIDNTLCRNELINSSYVKAEVYINVERNDTSDLTKVTNEKIREIIEDKSAFLDFYIKYKKQIFNPRYYGTERDINCVSLITEKKKPAIGMSQTEVRASTWGKPDKINKDTYEWGTSEQWVYNNKGYIFFKDGVVTSISER